MIKVGNREFRTLAQPIYINGTPVKEVWVNRTKVYPESGGGTSTNNNLVKLKAELLYSVTRSRGKWEYHYVDYHLQDPVTYLFSVSVKIVMVLQKGGDFYDDGFVSIQSADDNPNVITTFEQEVETPDVLGIYVRDDETFVGSHRLYPFLDNEGKNAPRYTSRRIRFRNATSASPFMFKLGARISINPVPLPPHYEARWNSYGDISTGYHYEAEPSGVLSSISGWNGQFLTYESESYSSGTSYYLGNVVQFNNPFGDGKLNFRPNSISGEISYISVFMEELSARYNVSNISRYDEQKPNATADISVMLTEFRVPVTDILYLGTSADAPEWATSISPGDL